MKAFLVFVSLLSVSCCAKASQSSTPDTMTTYQCICNNQDKGRCETVYIKNSERTWYVNFYFKGVIILKRINECRVMNPTAHYSDPMPKLNINLTIGRL